MRTVAILLAAAALVFTIRLGAWQRPFREYPGIEYNNFRFLLAVQTGQWRLTDTQAANRCDLQMRRLSGTLARALRRQEPI